MRGCNDFDITDFTETESARDMMREIHGTNMTGVIHGNKPEKYQIIRQLIPQESSKHLGPEDIAFIRADRILWLMSEIHMGHTRKEIAKMNRIRLVYEHLTDEEFRDHILNEKNLEKSRKYINEKYAEFTGTEVEDYV